MIYARVSTEDQSTALQIDESRAFCEARAWTVVKVIEDHASGIRETRPGLQQLLELAAKRKLDAVVVWKRDRLFRSLRHLVVTSGELEALGVDFVSVTEQIDTTTPHGKLVLQVLGALAEFERNLLVERTRAGMAAAQRRGTRIGRPPAKLDRQKLGKLRQAGATVRAIAKELGVGIGTIQRALVETSEPAEVSNKSGTCRICGCKDQEPCPEWVWVDRTETLCSVCGELRQQILELVEGEPLGLRRPVLLAKLEQGMEDESLDEPRARKAIEDLLADGQVAEAGLRLTLPFDAIKVDEALATLRTMGPRKRPWRGAELFTHPSIKPFPAQCVCIALGLLADADELRRDPDGLITFSAHGFKDRKIRGALRWVPRNPPKDQSGDQKRI